MQSPSAPMVYCNNCRVRGFREDNCQTGESSRCRWGKPVMEKKSLPVTAEGYREKKICPCPSKGSDIPTWLVAVHDPWSSYNFSLLNSPFCDPTATILHCSPGPSTIRNGPSTHLLTHFSLNALASGLSSGEPPNSQSRSPPKRFGTFSGPRSWRKTVADS